MKYLVVILLAGCSHKYIVVPVNSQQNEANCIVKTQSKIFLTICKDTKA